MPDLSIPQLCLLELHFRAIRPINKLPHYHGAHWSAMFRDLLRDATGGRSLSKAGIWVLPIEHGIISYLAGDPINVGLVFPYTYANSISAALKSPGPATKGGHFCPDVTVRYEGATCRITNHPWNPAKPAFLSDEIIADEIRHMNNLSSFTINFYTPMRLVRLASDRDSGHNHCDEEYFFDGQTRNTPPLKRLLTFIRPKNETPIDMGDLSVSGGAVNWLDVPYGKSKEQKSKKQRTENGTLENKTFGGIVGCLKIDGSISSALARRLVAGQYMGIGNKPVFGFGFYTIPELDAVRRIRPLTRGKSILERAATQQFLDYILSKLTSSSPGSDGITMDDIRRAGSPYLVKLCNMALAGNLAGKIEKMRLPKKGGAFREIYVQNSGERLVHRALAEFLTADIDRLLSDSSYAYRRGLSHKSAAEKLMELKKAGYSAGIKADIAAFYDTVDLAQLDALLYGYFPAEPAMAIIRSWLKNAAIAGAKGLPQGGILSPALSNLYLDRFDRAMDREGFRLVRYSDDFVSLFRDDMTFEEGKSRVESALARLGLELREDKTMSLNQSTPVPFLGYLVGVDGIGDPEKQFKEEDADWLPVFRDQWQTGQPVYLSTICRGAFSTGPQLIIRKSDDSKVTIPWSMVNRLIVVGRSPFSGGVIYRAMREGIPVSFIDIKGRTTGHLHATTYQPPEFADIQHICSNDEEFRLSFARVIISAKIHNSRVILRRNGRIGRSKEMINLADSAASAENFESLRGYEGAAARLYFEEFSHLVGVYSFTGRVYHPPDGPVNAMLSLGYSLLYNRIGAVLLDKGFNPRKGLFHQGRGSHMALASDLQEELRHIVDRIVLALIHVDKIKPESFTSVVIDGRQSVRMEGDVFRSFIRRYEMTMATEATFEGTRKMSYNAYLDEMAERLRRAMQLNIPYQPLRIR